MAHVQAAKMVGGDAGTIAPARRICSLLPSATEIVYALGLEDRLVAVTHECDYPPSAAEKPHITSSFIDSEGLSAAEIDRAVRDSLAEQQSIYGLDRELLERLQPDLMLTQDLCDVCAVGPPLVQDAVASLSVQPRVVSLEPHTVWEILDSILLVGSLAGVESRARELVQALRDRIEAIQRAVVGHPVRRVLTLEWVDPVFVGGHWVPQQVELAGGLDVLGQVGAPSREANWSEIAEAVPEIVVAMPCGFGLDRSRREMAQANLPSQWYDLPAVRAGEVYVVDGSSYFNRPGPRVVDGIEVLASVLHPEALGLSAPGAGNERAVRKMELGTSPQ